MKFVYIVYCIIYTYYINQFNIHTEVASSNKKLGHYFDVCLILLEIGLDLKFESGFLYERL